MRTVSTLREADELISAVKEQSHRRANAVVRRTNGMLWADVNRRALEFRVDRPGGRVASHRRTGRCLCHSWDQGSTIQLLGAILRP